MYVAAGEVFSLEAELGDLEEVARGVCSDTPGLELSFLEEQVASAAARVQQSELQVGQCMTLFLAENGILKVPYYTGFHQYSTGLGYIQNMSLKCLA